MSFGPVLQNQVGLDFGSGAEPLGKLALRDRKLYFEYNVDFITRNLNVSPFRLPLKSGVQMFENRLLEGLPGLFDDSLPDGWGRLLFDRSLRAQGLLPEQLSPLDRLAHVGNTGMGALTYKPDFSNTTIKNDIDLDWLAAQSAEVLEGDAHLYSYHFEQAKTQLARTPFSCSESCSDWASTTARPGLRVPDEIQPVFRSLPAQGVCKWRDEPAMVVEV